MITKSVIEGIVVLLLILGFIYDVKFIEFEDRMLRRLYYNIKHWQYEKKNGTK